MALSVMTSRIVTPWSAKNAAASVKKVAQVGALLIREDSGEGEPGVVIDGDADVVESDPA